jgi:hypothetical protein
MYSFLYKDNPFFKLGEHLYIGISMGYTLVRIYYDVMVKSLYTPMAQEGRWWLLLPAFLGILILSRYISRIAWLSRISFAFIVGFGSGVAIPRIISSYILQQIQGTLKPLVQATSSGVDILSWGNLNALLVLIGVITVLFYFFFSVEHTGLGKGIARTGTYFLMISFGAAFGYTVMARMSLLIGRFDDLLLYSSRSYGYATPILLILIILGLVLWELYSPSNPSSKKRPE